MVPDPQGFNLRSWIVNIRNRILARFLFAVFVEYNDAGGNIYKKEFAFAAFGLRNAQRRATALFGWHSPITWDRYQSTKSWGWEVNDKTTIIIKPLFVAFDRGEG